MKTIFKTLVILVVAVLIGGVFYGVVTANSSGSTQQTSLERPTDGEFARPDLDESGGFQFPFDAVKNLVIISVIAAIYLNAGKLFGGKKLSTRLNSNKPGTF